MLRELKDHADLSCQEGYTVVTHSLKLWCMHEILNINVNVLQDKKVLLGFTHASQEHEFGAIMDTASPTTCEIDGLQLY